MKRVFSANAVADEGVLQLLKSMLEEAAITCMVRNETLSIGKGDIPATECVPELWILEDTDFLKANKIVDEWKRSNAEPHSSWLCPHCKETIEGQFTSCWKCGIERKEK
jgi:hypothetical protein